MDVEVEHPLKNFATAIETDIGAKLTAEGVGTLLFFNHYLLTPNQIEKGGLKGATKVGLMPRFDRWDGAV